MQLHSMAQPQLPDLTGQPAWVQLVAIGLLVLGWVGTRWVSRGRDAVEDGDEDATESRPLPQEGVPSGAAGQTDHQSTAVIMRALDLLHQEAEESRTERGEAARWQQLAEQYRRERDECLDQSWPRDGGPER